MEKYVYVVVNYDYDDYQTAMDDFDYSDCGYVSSPEGAFDTPEVALECALDSAKEEADVYGRPYKITIEDNQCEEGCKEAVVHLLDDDSASVWAVRRMLIKTRYTPHMAEDMSLEVPVIRPSSRSTVDTFDLSKEELEDIKMRTHECAKRLYEAEKAELGLM